MGDNRLREAFTRVKMRLLPPSSRSFHESSNEIIGRLGRLDDISSQLDSVMSRLASCEQRQDLLADLAKQVLDEQQDARDWMYDEMERHATASMTRDAHARFYLESMWRHEGETERDARSRLFSGLPRATGKRRRMQLATAKLMAELDAICATLGIEYWFAYGTLVATLYRSGSIPWDDDIDICMRRADIDRLRAHLAAKDTGYRITEIYDGLVLCRQIRFSPTDPLVPCFIDISVWDDVPAVGAEADEALRQARFGLMYELQSMIDDPSSPVSYWAEHPFLRARGSGSCHQVEDVDWDGIDRDAEEAAVAAISASFEACRKATEEAGLVIPAAVAAPAGGAPAGIAYAVDNIYDAPWRRITWPTAMILPTRRMPYEGYEFSVPNEARAVCDECYPGSPYLPGDIYSHSHFIDDLLDDQRVVEAMDRFVSDEPERQG